MLQEFKGLRNEIRLTMIRDQDYKKSIELLNEYSQKLKSFNEDIEFDFWFINYNRALSYKKLGDIKNSMKYVKKSMQRYEYQSDHIQSLWLLGSIHEMLKNNRKAVQIYKRCCRCYKKIGVYDYRIIMLFNISKISNFTSTMKLIIKIYKNSNYTNPLETYGDMSKENILKNMYRELFELYIDNSDIKSCINLVHSISDTELKTELKKSLRSKMLVS